MATGNKEIPKPYVTINNIGLKRNIVTASKHVPSKAVPYTISSKNSESHILPSENKRPNWNRWKRSILGTTMTTDHNQGLILLQCYFSGVILAFISLNICPSKFI